jgi:hypothetical protein
MKKTFFLITIVLCCFAISNSVFAQKHSKSLNKIGKVYKAQERIFLKDAFALKKTGGAMDSTMTKAMEDKIFDRMVKDFTYFGKFSIKKDAEKTLELKLRGAKKYEIEGDGYLAQFKLLQNEFINQRLTWSKENVAAFLTQDHLQPYISAVRKMFENTLKTKFQNLKPT